MSRFHESLIHILGFFHAVHFGTTVGKWQRLLPCPEHSAVVLTYANSILMSLFVLVQSEQRERRLPRQALLGPNSTEIFGLEFWLEKPLEFWLEISLH